MNEENNKLVKHYKLKYKFSLLLAIVIFIAFIGMQLYPKVTFRKSIYIETQSDSTINEIFNLKSKESKDNLEKLSKKLYDNEPTEIKDNNITKNYYFVGEDAYKYTEDKICNQYLKELSQDELYQKLIVELKAVSYGYISVNNDMVVNNIKEINWDKKPNVFTRINIGVEQPTTLDGYYNNISPKNKEIMEKWTSHLKGDN